MPDPIQLSPIVCGTDYSDRFLTQIWDQASHVKNSACSCVHFPGKSIHCFLFFLKADSQQKREEACYKCNGDMIPFREQGLRWSLEKGIPQGSEQGPGRRPCCAEEEELIRTKNKTEN